MVFNKQSIERSKRINEVRKAWQKAKKDNITKKKFIYETMAALNVSYRVACEYFNVILNEEENEPL